MKRAFDCTLESGLRLSEFGFLVVQIYKRILLVCGK